MRREINQYELSFFYQKIGEAIWQLQHVEDLLINLYFIKSHAKEPNSIPEEEANKILKKLQKNTLGQLIGLIKNSSIMPNEFINTLKDFNETRKWVVHNSMRADGDELYTSTGRNEFVTKVCAFTDTAMTIQRLIEAEVLDYGSKKGFSKEVIFEMANEHISKLKGQA